MNFVVRKRKDSVIYKWRVKAMLIYIRHMIEKCKSKDDIVNVIDNYLKFIDEVKK